MTKFSLAIPFVANSEQQSVNEGLVNAINQLALFLDWGNGVPSHTPTGRVIFIRLDGGAGSTLYCWSGAAWNAFA